MTAATLKVYGAIASGSSPLIKAYYSVDNGVSYTEMAIAGGIYTAGTYMFNLSAALQASATNAFYVKIEAVGGKAEVL